MSRFLRRRWRLSPAVVCSKRVGRSRQIEKARERNRYRGPCPIHIQASLLASCSSLRKSDAAAVFRQNRILPSAAGTAISCRLIVGTGPVHHEEGSGQAVFRLTAVGRRTEARIAPGSGPLADGVDFRERERFLIADQGPIRRVVPSMLFSHRVFQKTSLPLKKARLTPASRAASTFSRWVPTNIHRARSP